MLHVIYPQFMDVVNRKLGYVVVIVFIDTKARLKSMNNDTYVPRIIRRKKYIMHFMYKYLINYLNWTHPILYTPAHWLSMPEVIRTHRSLRIN